jgi:hypothetical protein
MLSGGGIYAFGGAVVVTDTTFEANTPDRIFGL